MLLDTYPDGGIARFRAWGTVARDFDTELDATVVGAVDLLSAENGARPVGCSNRHYGEPRNLLRPGRGHRMDDGWETARNPNRPLQLRKDPATGLVDMPGAKEWAVLRLAAVSGGVTELHVDTAHFKGNFPESCVVETCDAPHALTEALLADDDEGVASADTSPVVWRPLLERTRLGPDAIHKFEAQDLVAKTANARATHLRVTMYPDGGIMRMRLFGRAIEPLCEDALDDEEGDGADEGGGHGGSHPHLVHEMIRSLIEDRDPRPNAVTAANWTCVGICAHESTMKGGELVRLPEFTLRQPQSQKAVAAT